MNKKFIIFNHVGYTKFKTNLMKKGLGQMVLRIFSTNAG